MNRRGAEGTSLGFLFSIPAIVIVICLGLATLAAAEVGYRFGTRMVSDNPHTDGAVGVVQNSVLGLMAFLLGLAFSFTSGRFEARHELEQKEANCLGTAYVRTELIDAPQGQQMRALFPAYVDARLDTYRAGLIDPQAYAEAKAKSDEVQAQIWKLDAEVFRANKSDHRTNLLTQALNNAFDAGGDVEESRRHRVPEVTYLLLFVSVLLSGAFVGYGFGRAQTRTVGAWILFATLTSATIFVILDLDRPERGLIRNEHIPLILLRQSLK